MSGSNEPKLSAYFWSPEEPSDGGIIVIAASQKEAKKIGFGYWRSEGDCEYILCRCHKAEEQGNIEGLPKGVVEGKEGLRRGLYGGYEDDCDMCGEYAMLSQVMTDTGKCICSDCDDKVYAAAEAKQ